MDQDNVKFLIKNIDLNDKSILYINFELKLLESMIYNKVWTYNQN